MVLEAAPPRGRYDRQLELGERVAQQLERLILATARAVEDSPDPPHASAAAIVALAGMGRNSFYAHFRDVHAAEEAVLAGVIERMHARADEVIARPASPIDLFAGLLHAWTLAIDDRRELAAAAFRIAIADRRGGLSRIGALMRQHLRRVTIEARRRAAIATPADELRLLSAAASMESLIGWYIDHPTARDDVIELGSDLLLRVFR